MKMPRSANNDPQATRSPGRVGVPLLAGLAVAAVTGIAGLAVGGTASALDLDDLWQGRATMVVDEQSGPFGGDFHMHFISPWWESGELRSYYIANYLVDGSWRSATGLATSSGGLDFTDQGIVMDIGGAWQWVYQADGDLSHIVGRADNGGWSANTAADPPGHLCYGPYATDIPAGANTVSFELMIDVVNGNQDVAGRLPVVPGL
jgi:hypothetical protein